MAEFTQKGRRMFGDINLEAQLHRAASAAFGLSEEAVARQQARAYSTGTSSQISSASSGLAKMGTQFTSRTRPCLRTARSMTGMIQRGFASTTNPNPPYGNKQKSR